MQQRSRFVKRREFIDRTSNQRPKCAPTCDR